MKFFLIIALWVMAFVFVTAGCAASRIGYETAPYQRVLSSGQFEVRDYPALTVVENPMTGTRGDAGFGRLFRFITGMAAEGRGVQSPPVFGYFDPPWAASFLRRNEVMLRTEPEAK